MKKLFAALICTLSLSTFAGTSSSAQMDENSGFIKATDVTGWLRVYHSDMTYDPVTGLMLVCRNRPNGTDRGLCGEKNNEWLTLQQAVPRGRTYIGFQFVGQYYVHIFWK